MQASSSERTGTWFSLFFEAGSLLLQNWPSLRGYSLRMATLTSPQLDASPSCAGASSFFPSQASWHSQPPSATDGFLQLPNSCKFPSDAQSGRRRGKHAPSACRCSAFPWLFQKRVLTHIVTFTKCCVLQYFLLPVHS